MNCKKVLTSGCVPLGFSIEFKWPFSWRWLGYYNYLVYFLFQISLSSLCKGFWFGSDRESYWLCLSDWCNHCYATGTERTDCFKVWAILIGSEAHREYNCQTLDINGTVMLVTIFQIKNNIKRFSSGGLYFYSYLCSGSLNKKVW